SNVADLARDFLRDPVRVEIGVVGSTADTVEQELVVINTDDRGEMLRAVLADAGGSALVFVRTRHGARKIARAVSNMGHAAAELHSDRTLPQRRAAMAAFKSGEATVLVATDIAARGIDVQGVALVVNYDLPDAPEDYVHRIGRTGRAGLSGKSITFASPEQAKDVAALEKTIGKPIPRSARSRAELPAWPPRRQPHQGGGGPGSTAQRRRRR
ncbi:DEAD/DEAH box helicase, partial [bacterium]